MAMATVYFIPSNIEPLCWLVIFIICAYLIGKVFFVPAAKPITQPYWLQNKMEEGYFNISDQQKIGQRSRTNR